MPVTHAWLPSFISKPLHALGQGTLLLAKAFGFMAQGRLRWSAFLVQSRRVGVDSIPMVLLLASIGGGVLALQSAKRFAETGADGYVGGLVALALVREIAPIFTALAVGARAGTSMASELAQMNISNQLDALQMMQVSPNRYLVVPRLLACLVCLPPVTLLAEVTAVLVGMVVSRLVTGLNYALYLESVVLTVTEKDLWVSLLKALLFGGLIAAVACTIGINTQGGAKEVGHSAMRAAVWSAILVIVADFVLSWFFFTGTSVF